MNQFDCHIPPAYIILQELHVLNLSVPWVGHGNNCNRMVEIINYYVGPGKDLNTGPTIFYLDALPTELSLASHLTGLTITTISSPSQRYVLLLIY